MQTPDSFCPLTSVRNWPEVPAAHCAPAISCHAFAALPPTCHLEYFHDHVRVEHLVFEGVPEPEGGRLAPDLGRAGHGLELKR